MNRKVRFFVVGLGLLGALIYLIYSGVEAEGVPYVRIHELLSRPDTSRSVVKVTGKVQKDTLRYNPETPLLKFSISDTETDKSIKVVYEGIKPDALRERGQVMLRGRYDSKKHLLQAHSLLAKCPSRYKSRYQSYREKRSSD